MNPIYDALSLESRSRWIELDAMEHRYFRAMCSNCGEIINKRNLPAICPHCGERMKGNQYDLHAETAGIDGAMED